MSVPGINAFDRLLTFVEQTLLAEPALADGGVHRMRARKVPEGVKRMIVVRKERADAQEAEILGGPLDWGTQIAVECYGRADDGLRADQVADALFQAAHARLQADPSLGGLALDLGAPRLVWDAEDEGANPAAATVAIYPVQHRTDPNFQELT